MSDREQIARCPECGCTTIRRTRTLLIQAEIVAAEATIDELDAGWGEEELGDTLDDCDDVKFHCTDCGYSDDWAESFVAEQEQCLNCDGVVEECGCDV